MADSVTLSVCLFCFQLHSLENRTKTDCNVKQKLNGSNFFYYSFYFLLQHSTSFAFWAPPRSSTPSCRCDLEARLRGHFLQRRPSTPRLGLRACIVSRFGCDSRNRGGDLGLGGWLGELGIWGRKRGFTCPHCAQICPRFLDLENNGTGGRKELRMRTRPNWLLDTCSNQ